MSWVDRLDLKLPRTVCAFAKPGIFDRNATMNPNITQNRNFSNVLINNGFANALLAFRWLIYIVYYLQNFKSYQAF